MRSRMGRIIGTRIVTEDTGTRGRHVVLPLRALNLVGKEEVTIGLSHLLRSIIDKSRGNIQLTPIEYRLNIGKAE